MMSYITRMLKASLAVVFLAILVSSVMCGCKEDPVLDIPQNALELFPRRSTAYAKCGERKRLDALNPEDVIVAVNGYPMTKAYYEELIALKVKYLMKQPGANADMVSQQIDEERQGLINNFVSQRLIYDAAIAQGVVSTNSIHDNIHDAILTIAKKAKKPPATIISRYEGKPRDLYYSLGMEYVFGKYVKEKIPPKLVVDDAFVAAAQKGIDEDNAETTKSNNVIRSSLVDIKAQIEAGKTTFEDVYRNLAGIDATTAVKDLIEEVERGEIDDKALQAAVFETPLGKLSNVVEGEEGYYLVKVYDAKPPERNEKGRVVRKERRSIIQIYMEKIPLISRKLDKDLFPELQGQMQVLAVKEFVHALETNGVNRVEYPNGRFLFDK